MWKCKEVCDRNEKKKWGEIKTKHWEGLLRCEKCSRDERLSRAACTISSRRRSDPRAKNSRCFSSDSGGTLKISISLFQVGKARGYHFWNHQKGKRVVLKRKKKWISLSTWATTAFEKQDKIKIEVSFWKRKNKILSATSMNPSASWQ